MNAPVRSAPIYPGSGPFGSLPRFRRDPLALLMSGFGDFGDVVRFRLFTRNLVLVAHPTDQGAIVVPDYAEQLCRERFGHAPRRAPSGRLH